MEASKNWTRHVYGRPITFEDGREGIITGGNKDYAWVKSLDGQIAHEYSLATIVRRILSGNEVYPLS